MVLFYLETVPVDLKVDDDNIEIPAAAAEEVCSVKVHDMEGSSAIAAQCDPSRTTVKSELILQYYYTFLCGI